MELYKDILRLFVLAAIFAPCLLVFNESDTFLWNAIGLAYCIFLYICFKKTDK